MRAPDFLCWPLVAVGCGSLVARSCFITMAESLSLTDILHLPIAGMPGWSNTFRARCRACRFTTLQDIVSLGAAEVSRIKYLGPDCFRELVDFLDERELLLLLPR
ncbi:hypothetical protein SAMN05660226_02345 [Parapedobacter luteus]|uniref:RNA polymerase, alpha chain C terminal domain n=2 Tax=Parapedobacter luteus TaxID=623280 RepID=A0A1T5CTT5_9SPHI|nr:hypothetical protein SAMN05660226_02345 [Parapedobacter luteus]